MFPCLGPVFMNLMLPLEHHEPATKGEDGRINSDPSEKDSKIEANPRVQPKEQLSTCFDDVVERETVPIVENRRFQIYVVE